MFHRSHGALRLPRSGESRKFIEVMIWMLIGLVVYVMIRFVLADIVRFARMPDVPRAMEWSAPRHRGHRTRSFSLTGWIIEQRGACCDERVAPAALVLSEPSTRPGAAR